MDEQTELFNPNSLMDAAWLAICVLMIVGTVVAAIAALISPVHPAL